MFGLLKKKLAGFSKKLKKKVEEAPATKETVEQPKPKKAGVPEEKAPEKPIEEKKPEKPTAKEDKAQKVEEEILKEVQEEVEKEGLGEKIEEFEEEVKERIELKEEILEKEPVEEPKQEPIEPKKPIEELTKEVVEAKEVVVEEAPEEVIEEPRKEFEVKKVSEDKRELKAKVGVKGKFVGRLFGGVEIKESDVNDLLSELELSLLESDVEQDAAHELVTKIKEKIIGQKVSPKKIDEFLNKQIKEILGEMMQTSQINILKMVKEKKRKPFKMLMLGPNGAGKTTTIAKLAHYFQKNGLSVIFAASDTFRAAAIDQLEEHAKKLNVRVVKHQYGSDPAAVAFDAVKAAEANKIDVVMIDSAGRQETNKNLMEELKKLERVAKSDLKIYVGEAYAGQGLLEQAKEFDESIGLDGFILTKIDTDAKGGTTISLLYKLKKPILYVGTGQAYEDFQEFTPEFILDRII